MMKHHVFKSIVLMIVAGAAVTFNLNAKTIRLFGSDLLDPWFPEAVQETTGIDGVDFSYFLTGSYGGLIALQNSYADVCVYLQTEEKLPTIPDGFESKTIAYYVTYLFAPDSFPQNSISKSQIAAICKQEEIGSTITWDSVLEDAASWSNELTHLIVETGNHGIHTSLLQKSFLNGEAVNDRVELVTEETPLNERINETDFFILASPNATAPQPSLKPLALADFGESVAFPATEENFSFGDYPATFPLLVIYPTNATWAQNVIQLLKESSVKKAFADHHLLPVEGQ